MHLKRWITGLVALPFLVFSIYMGGIYFTLLVGIAVFFAFIEYLRIMISETEKRYSLIPILGIATGMALICLAHLRISGLTGILLAFTLVISGFISIFQFKQDETVLEVVKTQIHGIIYIALLASFLILIRNGANGLVWIFFLLGIVFSGDISAYYVGSHLGRHKLCPAVSPGKTMEGAVGGLLANVGMGSLIKYYFLPELSWGICILFFLLVGVAGQAGDLFESEMKRSSRIKDSGGLLPGHGGFLDRIDALLFASPIAYVFKEYIF